jgi:hypothetical protein
MSRSVRRRPYAAYCGGSQKKAKVCCNRMVRHKNRLALYNRGEDAKFFLPDEVMSAWSMPQDGSRGWRSWPRYRQHVLGAPPPKVWNTRREPEDLDVAYRRWFRWVKAK